MVTNNNNQKAFLAPGSAAALDAGCVCAVIDNHYGKGFLIDGVTNYWFNPECPLHGTHADVIPKK